MKVVVAEEYLCFDALFEMIVSDIKPSSNLSQIDFAGIFGITLPIGSVTSIKNVRYSNNINEYGTNICVKEINEFFQSHSIPLSLSFIKSNCLNEMTFSDLIFSQNNEAYVVFAFCYGLLYNESQNNDVGHVALLYDIDMKSDTITIYDPGPRDSGEKNIKIYDMLYAMKKRGGIYIFKRLDDK